MQRATPSTSSTSSVASTDASVGDSLEDRGDPQRAGSTSRPALASQSSCASIGSDAALIDDEADRIGGVGQREAVALARDLLRDADLSTPPGSDEARIDHFLVEGDPAQLPAALRAAVEQRLEAAPAADRERPSVCLRAALAALSRTATAIDAAAASATSILRSLDARPIGRATLNLAHGGARNFIAVALPTMVRQAVGRALELALRQGPAEVVRTVLSCVCLMLPAIGQGALFIRDERGGRATAASRLARCVAMSQQTAVTALGVATGTVMGLGHCVASGLLYPLMRDTVQARVPLRTDPPTGPTRVTLAASVLAYALGQLMLSRIFLAFPDAVADGDDAGHPLASGCAMRGLANGAFELLDMLVVVGAQHLARHGQGSQPRVRIGSGDLARALRSQQHWDTMSARSAHVLTIGQLYQSLSANHMLPAALAATLGAERADLAADWITEAVAFGATALSYAVWTDPLHARGAVLQTLEEAHRGEDPPRQYAGNQAEPAVAGARSNDGELIGYVRGSPRARSASLTQRRTSVARPAPPSSTPATTATDAIDERDARGVQGLSERGQDREAAN